jgi:peptidoglycan hydrolase-like protein with peptidoglycan-binding domain
MKISTNTKRALLFGLPVVVGIFLIYKQISKSKAAKAQPAKSTPPQPKILQKPTQPTGNDSFPLKVGSRDAGAPYAPAGRVVALQKMINIQGYDVNGTSKQLKEDGIFGPKTEAAVNDYLSKKTVDNLDDWNSIFRIAAPYIAAPATDPNAIPDYNDNILMNF